MHIAILCISAVPICTGRVEAKISSDTSSTPPPWFQSARGVWRQRSSWRLPWRDNRVPICTGRVEAKISFFLSSPSVDGSNLHGACGGKGTDIKDADYIESRSNLHGACGGKAKSYSLFFSFRSSNLHGACGGKGRMCTSAAARGTLQSARGVWRQRQDCGCHKMAYCRCNLHGTCRETERHHPSPEKNPRKFMQTYCIFIHLAV